jgi:hypothetical protein
MSSYASLSLHGVEIFTWRNEIDPTFLFLFTSQDVHRTPRWSDNEYEPREVVLLRATASVLQDRLDVLGIGKFVLETSFSELIRQEFMEPEIPYPDLSKLIGPLKLPESSLVKTSTLDDWVRLFAQALTSPQKRAPGAWAERDSATSLLDLWQDTDPRLVLAAILLGCNPLDEITLDVSELMLGGWISEDFDPQSVALDHFSYSLANGSPPVVITEGSTDARVLQAVVRIRYPHLQSFIKFFDFADGAEGSAAAGVRTLKSFAAAGISNRVVLLLDNDTAARDALRTLRGTRLPKHYSTLHYPDIEVANSYPTLGPTGLSEMNVNGLAGSIEMYLGVDVLIGADGKLTPVQWRSYVEGAKAYQGEILDKTGILKRFREKVRAAEADPSVAAEQDWSGLEAIIEKLIEVLRT